jgi:CheY-like chemotaxis protein
MTGDSRLPTLVRRRSEADVLLDQLRGIDAWTRAHSLRAPGDAAAASRESRLDLARRMDVVTRQRQAVVDWTERQLRRSGHLLRSVAAPRAVVAHRQEWFSGRLVSGLEAGGVVVLADLANGAEALGVLVAEQPDFLVLEDKLPMVRGLELAEAAARYAPSTLVVVQVANEWEIGPFLDAGATRVYTRRIPPSDIVADLLDALAG